MSMRPDPRPDVTRSLRELLRRNDPAAGRELSPHEVAGLRHQVVEAAAGSRGAHAFPRLAAMAAALACLVLAGWWLWPAGPDPEAVPRIAAPVQPVAPQPPTRTAPPEPEAVTPPARVARRDPAPPRTPGPRPGIPSHRRPAPPERKPAPPAAPPAAEMTVAREIRFDTAGGTRLIWIFQPDEPLTTDEGVS